MAVALMVAGPRTAMNPHAPGLATAFVVSGLNLGAVVGPAGGFGLRAHPPVGLIGSDGAVVGSAALVVSGLWALAAAGMNVAGRLMQGRHEA